MKSGLKSAVTKNLFKNNARRATIATPPGPMRYNLKLLLAYLTKCFICRSYSIVGLDSLLGLKEVEVHRRMKVVSLPVLRTGRVYPQKIALK
jgi:hypothetical protein